MSGKNIVISAERWQKFCQKWNYRKYIPLERTWIFFVFNYHLAILKSQKCKNLAVISWPIDIARRVREVPWEWMNQIQTSIDNFCIQAVYVICFRISDKFIGTIHDIIFSQISPLDLQQWFSRSEKQSKLRYVNNG